ARLIGYDHARLERLIAAARPYALRPFMDVEKGANTVTSAVAVVETSVPHAGACQPIQHDATGAFWEFLPGQGDVTAQDQSVEVTLALRGRADADGARVIGRSTEYLYTRIYEKKFAIAQVDVRTGLAVMHDSAVGSSSGNGREAEIAKARFA